MEVEDKGKRTGADRQRDFAERQKAAGYKRTTVWIHEGEGWQFEPALGHHQFRMLKASTQKASSRATFRGYFTRLRLAYRSLALTGNRSARQLHYSSRNLEHPLQRTPPLADNSFGGLRLARNRLIAFGLQLSSARL